MGRVSVGILLLIIVFVCSCNYDTDELTYQDVRIPDPEYPAFWLDMSDTVLIIYEDHTFQYGVHLDSQLLLQTEFFIDDKKVHSDTGSFGSFTTYLHDGTHTMDMFIYTSSGSGSIREILGGEIAVFSRSWQLIKERPLSYRGVEFLWSDILDGKHWVAWEAYDDFRFQAYEVRSEKPWYSMKVEDVTQTRVSDPYYVGGPLTYYLNVYTTDNLKVACDTISYNNTNELNYRVDDMLNLTLSWKPCPVTQNFAAYSVTRSINSQIDEFTLTEIMDTTLTFPFGVFPPRTFELTTHGKEYYNGAGKYSFSTEVWMGESIASYSAVSRTMFQPYKVYSSNQVFDPLNNIIVEQTLPAPSSLMQVSPDNTVLSTGSHWMDPSIPEIWHKLEGVPEDFEQMHAARISLSGNQLGIFESDNTFLVYDFRNDSVRTPWERGSLRRRQFSPNGRFYLGLSHKGINICKPDGSDWKVEHVLEGLDLLDYYNGYYPYLFLPDMEKSRFVFIVEGKLILYSCEMNRAISSVDSPAQILVDLDPQTSTLLCAEGLEKYYLYSIPDLSLIREIDISRGIPRSQNLSRTSLAYSCGRLFIRDDKSRAYSFQVIPPNPTQK